MNDFQQQYALWDDFLTVWLRTRLATMTLDEYSQAGLQGILHLLDRVAPRRDGQYLGWVVVQVRRVFAQKG